MDPSPAPDSPPPSGSGSSLLRGSQRWGAAGAIGPYRLVSEVARGGAGSVWRALREDGGVVALKLLLAGRGAGHEQRRRFEGEVRALLRIRHPHVVAILDAGQHEGCPWLAMEWVEGTTLAARVEERGPLEPAAAIELGQRLAGALAHCHAQGLVHRDLTPRNVLLRASDGVALLTDFGLAKDLLPDAQTQSLGQTIGGRFLGTPGYWPPEQARGDLRQIGPRSDVYGLGALLYFALTGLPPQRGESLHELLARIEQPPEPPGALRPGGLPGWLERLVLSCLAADPRSRPSGMEEVERRLARGEGGARRARSRGLLRIGAGALLLAGALLGGVLLVRAREDARLARQQARAEELIGAASPDTAALGALLGELDPGSPLRPALSARLDLESARALLERGEEALVAAAGLLDAAQATAERDRRLRPLLRQERERLQARSAAAEARRLAREAWQDKPAVLDGFARALAAANQEPQLVRALRLDRARFLFRRGAFDQVLEEVPALAQDPPDRIAGEARMLAANALLAQGWFGEFQATLQQVAAEWGPDTSLGLAARAHLSGFPGQDARAGLAMLDQLVFREPDDLDARLIRLEYMTRVGIDARAALDELDALLEGATDDARVPSLEALLADLAGDPRRSDAALARAELLTPDAPWAPWIRRGLHRLSPTKAGEARSARGALSDFARARQLAPGDPMPRLLEAMTRVHQGDLDAMGLMGELAQRYPEQSARYVENLPEEYRTPLRQAMGNAAQGAGR